MDQTRICLTTSDRHRLYLMLSGIGHHLRPVVPHVRDLEEELKTAAVVAPAEAAPDLLTMHSTFRATDLATGEDYVYTLVYPAEGDVAAGKISVLTPAGAAALGQHVGDVVEWPVAGGARRLRIDELIYQPEAAGDFHL
jgi:regulator of nucleoside diphosphate kinase